MTRTPDRAWVRLPSGRRLDLLSPTPLDWTDEDLATGLSRTFRWGGHSAWPEPLSVAQHSLTVLEIRRARAKSGLAPRHALRELLHDADEGLINFDCIAPLKPFLGERFAELAGRLAAVIAQRYGLPPWTPEEKRVHKSADITAAAAEAVHVVGWTEEEVAETLGIRAKPLARDPLVARHGGEPWHPWPPPLAAERFLAELKALQREG